MQVGNNGATEGMRVFSNGNVGIGTGTTNNGVKLQVTGDISLSGFLKSGTSNILLLSGGALYHYGAGGSTSHFFVNTFGGAAIATMRTEGMAIGSTALASTNQFQLEASSTRATLLSRMTTAQFNAIASKPAGLQSYSTDDAGMLFFDGTRVTGFRFNGTKFQGYNGTTWVDLN